MIPSNRICSRAKTDVLGRDQAARREALHPRNINAWCVIATMTCSIIAGRIGDAAAAQPPTTQSPPSSPAVPKPPAASPDASSWNSPPIDKAQALVGYRTARTWLSAFDAPRMDAAESNIAIDNATAVCVILRRHGRTMGVGVDDSGDALMIRRALGRAMNEALSDPALQSLAASILRKAGEGDAAPAERDHEAEAQLDKLRRDLGRTLTLELEIAGPRTPLVGATLESMAMKIEPGIDGLSLRRDQAGGRAGRGTWQHVFPAQLRATNLAGDPLKSLTSLALNAGFAMNELDDAATLRNASAYQFRTLDLAQSQPDAEPIELFRGERLISQSEITRDRVGELASDLVRRLLRCRFPDPPQGSGESRLPLGFMGDYSPAADQFSPTTAPPLEQALCALALTRYAQSPLADAELAKDAAVAARQALRDLADVHERETPPTDDPAACAAMIMLAAEMPSCLGDSRIAELIRATMQKLEQSFDAQRGFIAIANAAGEASQPPSPIAQAMIACAWSRLLIKKTDALPAPDAFKARAAIDAAWQSSPEHLRVALLPWIGWAERDCAVAMSAPLAHVEDLKRLADALDRTRVPHEPDIPPDLHGGFALTGSARSDGVLSPRPSSQSVRPAAWLAGIAFDQVLTQQEQQTARWESHLRTMQFICQLSASDTRASTLRNPLRVRGGLFAAPWDHRQPVAAQALGLLAAVETLSNWPKTP